MSKIAGGKGLFFDRDNTLNADPVGYISNPDDIHLLSGVREVLKEAKAAGYKLFMITNQSGISRGFFTLEEVNNCHRRLLELIGDSNIFTEIGIATGTAEQPDSYRKPSPRFVEEMCVRHGLNPTKCWAIGDRECDLLMAHNARIRGILVETGNDFCPIKTGEKSCAGRFKNLQSAWKFIQKTDRSENDDME